MMAVMEDKEILHQFKIVAGKTLYGREEVESTEIFRGKGMIIDGIIVPEEDCVQAFLFGINKLLEKARN